MAEHEDAESVMSQVKLAGVYQAAGEVHQAIGLLERALRSPECRPETAGRRAFTER